MVAALYRRYRPESFAELIGQAHVTEPLSAAIRADRVGHAYLFSGPRGCGKTTSARILARCLNCAQGPTPTPCGECDSCRELGRDGGGSLDVVEIDAASHNGVDDARDLRERAAFAPARDRFKIFILDEAHMVTSQGFNALLKIVEEPPPHVKFIFATTEPEKVIGTIRSRTHHYPFRLIPPAPMLEYVTGLCETEGVQAQPGVLPLVIRGGGGSGRDTLSLLDQLIAGADGTTVTYEQAVALLGYTHAELLDAAVDALGARDAAGVFSAVDRVIQSGQDPRRFVEDLLERLRDLIVVSAAHDPAALMHGVPVDELDAMARQASAFGPVELSRAADIVAKALTDMTGATSPKVHLELMAARLLVPAAGDPELGALARVERLERRVGVDGVAGSGAVAGGAGSTAPAVADAGVAGASRAPSPSSAPRAEPDAGTASVGATSVPAEQGGQARTAGPSTAAAAPREPGSVSFAQVRDAWDEVLVALGERDRKAWLLVSTARPLELRDDDVLVMGFTSETDHERFVLKPGGATSPAEHLRAAIQHVLGITVKYVRRLLGRDAPAGAAAAGAGGTPAGGGVAGRDVAGDDAAGGDPVGGGAAGDDARARAAADGAVGAGAASVGDGAGPAEGGTGAVDGGAVAMPERSAPATDPAASAGGAARVASATAASDGAEPRRPQPARDAQGQHAPPHPAGTAPLQSAARAPQQGSTPRAGSTQQASAPSPQPDASAGWAVAAIPASEPEAPLAPVTSIDTHRVTPPPADPSAAPVDDRVPPAEPPDDEPPFPDDARRPTVSSSPAPASAPRAPAAPASSPSASAPPVVDDDLTPEQASRYGESVVREELGAELIEEIPLDGGR